MELLPGSWPGDRVLVVHVCASCRVLGAAEADWLLRFNNSLLASA
jgi:hypothetical protein